MTPSTPSPLHAAGASAGHIALRNTFGLLALSLLTALVGVWVGINLRITEGVTGVLALALLLLGGAAMAELIGRYRHGRFGLTVLFAFTFFTGLMLSLTLVRWLGFYNTGNALMTVFSAAAAVLMAAAGLGGVFKLSLTPLLQGLLVAGLLAGVMGLADALLRSSTPLLAIAVLTGGALGALMLHLQQRLAHQAHPATPTAATLAVYLALFSGFASLSPLIGRSGQAQG